jgi:hypothetical protein
MLRPNQWTAKRTMDERGTVDQPKPTLLDFGPRHWLKPSHWLEFP